MRKTHNLKIYQSLRATRKEAELFFHCYTFAI